MQIVTPDIGLICWTLFSFAAIALFFAALISIFRRSFTTPREAMFWMLIILFMPILGAVLYFSMRKQTEEKKQVAGSENQR